MRRLGVIVACAISLGAVGVPAATSAPSQSPRLVAPPATLVQYGYVRSLVRSGSGYRMRFDPAFWLSGQTANRAAIEDGDDPGQAAAAATRTIAAYTGTPAPTD